MGQGRKETLINTYAPIDGHTQFHLSWEIFRVGLLPLISGNRGTWGLNVLLAESHTGNKCQGQDTCLVPICFTLCSAHAQ